MKYDYIIRGTIGVWWDGTTADDLRQFLASHQEEDLIIGICSLGGYLQAGLEMYQLLLDHGRCTAVLMGMTASAATIAAMGCKKVKAHKRSLVLIHNASDWVDEWGQCNKEQIDAIITRLNATREQLDTIDKLLAGIYADRCGKSLEDICATMAKNQFITADDAHALGIIDELIDAPLPKQVEDSLKNSFTNSYIQGMGMPSPTGSGQRRENPIAAFFRKTAEVLRGPSRNEPAQNSTEMKKFVNLCACLAITALAFKDGKAELTEEQAGKIEAYMKGLADKVTELTDEKKQLEQQVDNLKKSAGGEVEDVLEDAEMLTARQMYNAVMGNEKED